MHKLYICKVYIPNKCVHGIIFKKFVTGKKNLFINFLISWICNETKLLPLQLYKLKFPTKKLFFIKTEKVVISNFE